MQNVAVGSFSVIMASVWIETCSVIIGISVEIAVMKQFSFVLSYVSVIN